MTDTRVFYGLLLSSYKTSKFGLLMLAASMIIAASGLSAVLIINDSAKQSYSSNSALLVPNVSYQVVASNTSQALSKADYARLRTLGFTQLIAVARKRAHIYTDVSSEDDQSPRYERISKRAVDFTGIDTFALIKDPNVSSLQNQSERKQAQGSDVNTDNLIALSFSQARGLLHQDLLRQLRSENDSAQFFIEYQEAGGLTESNCDRDCDADSESGARSEAESDVGNPDTNSAPKNGIEKAQSYRSLPPLTALNDATLGNDIILDIAVFSQLFSDTRLLALLWTQDASAPAFMQRKAALEAALPSHLSLAQLSSGEEQGELTKSFHLNLLAMALLMFVVCLFIVLNAVNLLINARMPWLKICRQLGIGRNTIFAVQLLEIVFITLVCVLVGILCGLYLSNIVSPSVQATLEGLYKVQVGFGRISLISLFMQVSAISLIGSILAVYIPFRQVDRSLALNGYSQAHVDSAQNKSIFWRHLSPFWLSAIGFAVLASALLLNSTQLWLLLIATACLILAGCSLLIANYPLVLRWVAKCIPMRFTLLRVSAHQSLVLSRKTKIACCAFFIAATSNIGMNLMVDSFRGATVSWLDSRLASDYYLYYSGELNVIKIAADSQVVITPRYEIKVSFRGKPVQQFSYPTSTNFKQAMVFYKVEDIDAAWQAFENKQATFVNQQFAFYFNLDLGDTVTLPHPVSSVPTDYEIKGVIYDFGSPNKQVLLPISEFASATSNSFIYAIDADEAQIEHFIAALAEANDGKRLPIIKTEELLAISMKAFDDTFLITDGLNIVTLLVAALSLACAIIVLMDDVRPQNMLIRSLGVSAIKTQALALFQYILLCFVALLFATPFGILLSWVLIFEINYQAFQWTYPLQIDIAKIMQIYAISLLVVLAVISIPLFRASKKPLIEDIRWLN